MRPENPARLIAILSPWLLLACSSAGVSTSTPSGSGGHDGTAGNGGGGSSAFLSTGQTVKTDAGLEQLPSGCGDGVLTKDEACDDHNTLSNDGCSADCRRVDPGYSCFPVGQPCHRIARCGDGVKVQPEQCDDGNTLAGDGCSPVCKIETGFQCSGTHPNDPNDTSTSVCAPTVCGDGKIEGIESCDDGNSMPFDGCSADCQNEPHCTGDACTLGCGDGIKASQEQCDDGNTIDGDGCSRDCMIEAGWTCAEPTLVEMVPVIYRDFRDGTPPEFGASVTIQPHPVVGIVTDDLDADGKPVYRSGIGDAANITGAETFAEWYRDWPGINHSTTSKMALWNNGQGRYVNRYGPNGEQWQETIAAAWCGTVGHEVQDPYGNPEPCTYARVETVCDDDAALGYRLLTCSSDGTNYSAIFEVKLDDGNPLFFPVDDDLFTPLNERSFALIPGDYHPGGTSPLDVDANGNERMHNFNFTSELRYWFLYDQSNSYRVDFATDGDAWIFINKKLALDLGGVHEPAQDTIMLDAEGASSLGLADGNVYEIAVFQAQRRPSESSYKLILSGFHTTPSQCTPKCGDGIVSLGEECDDGVNAGGYGQCGQGCKLGAYCGDGIVQSVEDCDDGVNNGHPCPSGCRSLIDN